MKIASVFLTVAVLIGCSRQSGREQSRRFDGPQAVANLKSQAAEVEQAMMAEDHGRMADLTHPVLLDHFGGRSGYIKKLQETAGDVHRQGLRFHAFRFGTLSELREASGELYAVYRYSLELTLPNGVSADQPAYLVCTSSDHGATWRFLDGVGIGMDRRKLKQVLPRFPNDLPLPESKPETEGK